MIIRHTLLNFLLVTATTFSLGAISSHANAAAEDFNKDADQALQSLYKINPVAADVSKNAKSVLVFPKVIKAGLVFGGSNGEDVLTKDSQVVDYNSVFASCGLQAGAESYGYVVFLMSDKAVQYLDKSNC